MSIMIMKPMHTCFVFESGLCTHAIPTKREHRHHHNAVYRSLVRLVPSFDLMELTQTAELE